MQRMVERAAEINRYSCHLSLSNANYTIFGIGKHKEGNCSRFKSTMLAQSMEVMGFLSGAALLGAVFTRCIVFIMSHNVVLIVFIHR